ncbi:Ankycorbin [Dactylellina cionopaga]|nr:Ankycorbin [Dactylellina cionopaga]
MDNSRMWSSHVRENAELKSFIDEISRQIQTLENVPDEQKKMNMLLQHMVQNLSLSSQSTPSTSNSATRPNTPSTGSGSSSLGADATREDGQNQLSALEFAWTQILGGAFSDTTTEEMKVLFNDRDCLEEFGFSTIHKIILGLTGINLEDQLKTDLLELNIPDHNGRTSLSWAAQRGDLEKVNVLLEHGADPNICTARGHSPLQYASSSRSPECIKVLLAFNADPQQSDPADQNPLHYTLAKQIDNLDYIKPLIDAGIDVNKPTNYGFTPLIMAVQVDSYKSAKYLIDQGAEVNLRGQDGKTALWFALEFSSLESLKLLRKHGADFSMVIDDGSTFLHCAARFSSKETFETLMSFGLDFRGVKIVNKKGFTAHQTLLDRQSDPLWVEISQAFHNFVESLPISLEEEDRDAEDEFYDAKED